MIALDVDGVVVDTVPGFIQSGMNVQYWKNPCLYDCLDPHDNITEVLDRLLRHDSVVFLTTCYEEHIYSKFMFLQRHFPNIPFVNMKNKGLFPAKLLIDDGSEVIYNFQKMNPTAKTILTSYGNTLADIIREGY